MEASTRAGMLVLESQISILQTVKIKKSPLGGIVLGYKFNKYLDVEGQYTGIGKVTDKVSGTIKGDVACIALIGFLPLKDEFNLYGKLGAAATKNQGIIKPCANE